MNLEELDLRDAQALREFITSSFSNSPNRRDHILAVSDYCREVGDLVSENHPELGCDSDLTERAGLVHDIGYLPEVQSFVRSSKVYKDTGWHPIDGANFLRLRGEQELAQYIEGHGNSLEVAVAEHLPLFEPSGHIIAKIVTFCDSQTGPTGERISYSERLKDIAARHGAQSVAVKAHFAAQPRVSKIIEEISGLIA